MSSPQFWDTSAVIPLIFNERRTADAKRALDVGERRLAWDWMLVEAHSTLCRRGATRDQFAKLRELAAGFRVFNLDLNPAGQSALFRLLEKHRLRSADAGHLHVLKQVAKLPDKLRGKLEFVCFDDELVAAAEREGVRVFGRA